MNVAPLQLPLALVEPGCQRWAHGRASYRPPAEVIDTRCFEVDELDEHTAKAYVIANHYSGSYPAARLRVGLYRRRRGHQRWLCGVAVFSVPLSAHAVRRYASRPATEGVELGRFVLDDAVEANAETWFLARAFRVLRERLPQVRIVLSYSDPLPRRSISGDTVLAGHVGTIYQAFNGRYVGRAKRRTLVLDRSGRIVSERTLSKLRQDDRGAAYAYRQLRERGAPPRQPLESGRAYVSRVLGSDAFRRLRHSGNHVYVWPVGSRRLQGRLRAGLALAERYPKRIDARVN
ncbi:MAG TPA: hypothetical protein VFA48_08390 [Gammaproteobacteria bacterium]|nr:hypothetical protein [Gammaproteobacteria bacterium]